MPKNEKKRLRENAGKLGARNKDWASPESLSEFHSHGTCLCPDAQAYFSFFESQEPKTDRVAGYLSSSALEG